MALVAMPLAQSYPIMQNLKHYIDLTEDFDGESQPTPKRQKSSDIPETQNAQPPPSNRPLPVPRQTTPIGEPSQSIKSRKVVTNHDSNDIPTRSPFKNRPSWSKYNSKPPAQPNFSKLSPNQSEQSKNGLPHQRSALQNGSAKASELTDQQENRKQPIDPTQESLAERTAVALPINALQNDVRHRGNAPSIPEGVPPHVSISKSISLNQGERSSTPLPDRPRNWPPATPTEFPNTSPITDTPASQISVVIDNSQRTASALLSKFIQPVPVTSARLSERSTAERKPVKNPEYRYQLLGQLKNGTSVVHSRASSVEAVFGPHGLSRMYSTASDKGLRKQLAQPKVKKIRRKEIRLDWTSAADLAQEPFEPKKLISPKEQAQEILRSKFDDNIEPPVTFVNDVNDKQLSDKFQFISSYIRRLGVEAPPTEARNYGCKCVGGCKPDSCGCLVDDKEIDDFGDETDHGKIVPYQRVLDATRKPMSILRDDYMRNSYADGEKSEIIECNKNCGCGADCWNRVVQKGRTLPLEIFMTARCGFGIRSPQNIIKGQLVDLYLGEVITETEVENRELATDGAPSYIFTLDWFQSKEVYYVDSLNFGTPTRFLNHSCDPNCRVFTVILNRADKKVYGLAFFATRNIPAATELNIDYNPQEAGNVYAKPRPGDDAGVVLCQCGSRNCRVRLWPGPKMKKGKGWARS